MLKDWLPAVILGALVAGAGVTWSVTHPAAESPARQATPQVVQNRWVFLDGPVLLPGATAQVLVVEGRNTTEADALDARIPEWCAPTTGWAWRTESIGIATLNATAHDCGMASHCPVDHEGVCPEVAGPDVAHEPGAYLHATGATDPDARFGEHGQFAVRITYFVFLTNGRLLASNADAIAEARFEPAGDFVHFDPGVLWLGDEPNPAGTSLLPSLVRGFAPIIRENLTGLPEGAIVSRELVDHPGSDVFGRLFLTVRIDDLVST